MNLSSKQYLKTSLSILLARLRLAVMLSITSFAALTMPGCGGCSCNGSDDAEAEVKDDTDEEPEDDEKEKEEKKPDFEIVERPSIFPSDEDSLLRPVKPGHWVQTAQEIRTNNFDFYADLQTESLGKDQQPLGLDGSGYHVRVSRPAAFAKGEAKQVRTNYFIPKLQQRESQQAWLGFRLLSRKSGRQMLGDVEATSRMPGFQYFFVVLSDNPVRYGYLKKLHSIAPPRSDYRVNATKPRYRVILPKFEAGRFPLPDYGLAWTSIAYLLWDEIEPARLTTQQQTALLDWLHWGGQIIIDGPGSLEKLQNSFLADYLPARKNRTVELRQSDFDELNSHWSRAETAAVRKVARRLDLAGETVLGIEIDKLPDADYLPGTGRLVVERQVGRGRVVVSAFSLSSAGLRRWTYLDGFASACLLRLPSRKFQKFDGFSSADVLFPGYIEPDNPLLSSTLRFFTRDIGPAVEPIEAALADPTASSSWYEPERKPKPSNEIETSDTWRFGGYEADPTSGAGGWSDFSGAAEAARTSLKDAAGISTPSRKLVLAVLAAYLLVLVPVNWVFFRLIGRVEWAWVAAPLIAVVGAVVVVRSAQLDIGFVRSRTEIGVLELHGGYSRGHLTRFTAFYSSLSTTYELALEDPHAQALPFAGKLDHGQDKATDVIEIHEGKERILDGYKVRSNSTGILRSESMYRIDGPIKLVAEDDAKWRVVNASGIALRDVGVLRRDQRGNAEVAWVGELDGDETALLKFAAPKDNRLRPAQWNGSPTAFSIDEQVRVLLAENDANGDGQLDRDELKDQPRLLEHFQRSDDPEGEVRGQLEKNELSVCCRLAREGELRLGRFFDLATEQLQLGKGEVRLIGWTDRRLEGVEIRPQASQTLFRTFVLVHLRAAKPLPAEPDRNHYLDVAVEDPYD